MSLDPEKSLTPTNASTASVSRSSTRKWWQLGPLWAVPAVALASTFGVFAVRRPGSVKAMLTNPQGLAMTAAAIGVGVIAVWASQFRPKIRPVLPFVVTAGILGAAVYAEVPFERSSTQNRTIVAGPVRDVDATTTTTPVGPTTPTAAAVAPTATTSRPGMPTTSAPTATRHATGQLRGIDHTASGTVSAIESPTGDWVVRFEDFDVQFTPTPVLYVVDRPDEENKAGTRIGAFTATNGTLLDVPLPAGIEPRNGWTVLIWCERFDTPIANVTLA